MRNRLAEGASRLAARLRQNAGIAVDYIRGSTTLAAVPATIGRTVFATNLDGGARIEFGEIDFLLSVDALTSLQGPAEGDRITATINGMAYLFELIAPRGEPPFRFSDATKAQYRLHCKRVVT